MKVVMGFENESRKFFAYAHNKGQELGFADSLISQEAALIGLTAALVQKLSMIQDAIVRNNPGDHTGPVVVEYMALLKDRKYANC